jgi:hypothetical protein
MTNNPCSQDPNKAWPKESKKKKIIIPNLKCTSSIWYIVPYRLDIVVRAFVFIAECHRP